MNCGKTCVLILAVLPAVFADIDYCAANLCDEGKKHIACGNDGDFGPNCVSPQLINITIGYRRLITRVHNSLRNTIAKGFRYFPTAKRMATMKWGNELAKLAELNVKRCQVQQDECRNTPKFPFVGQNIASTRWRLTILNKTAITEDQIYEWFRNYEHCNLDVLKQYKPSNRKACASFTTMVQEKTNRLGCAIIRTLSCGHVQQIMACNYAYDNKLGEPVYSVGLSASQCTTGTNSRFPFLCSVQEVYNWK